jgi:hypothetical protein
MAMNRIRVDTAYTYTAPGEGTVSVTPGTWSVGDEGGAVPLAAAEHGVAEGFAVDMSEQSFGSRRKRKGST